MKITESMDIFLQEIKGKRKEKTVREYEGVLHFFKSYLTNYGEVECEEDERGNYRLVAETTEIKGGLVNHFLNWFMIRKVLGPAYLMKTAPKVMKAYIKWLGEKNLLSGATIQECFSISKEASSELPRVEKVADLLYGLSQGDRPGFTDFLEDPDDYRRRQNEWISKSPRYSKFAEGYGEVIHIGTNTFTVDLDGEKIGPVKATEEICRLLKPGDTINLELGKSGKLWHVLEVGNVYPG